MNFPDADILLGLDWFNSTGACLDPKNKKIHIPLDDDVYDCSDELSEYDTYCLLVDNNLVELDSLVEDDAEVSWELNYFNNSSIINNINNFKKFSEDEKKKIIDLAKIIDKMFASNYDSLGCCNIRKHVIKTITEDPIYLYTYRKSEKERLEINNEIDKLLKAGIIRH